MFKIAKKSLIIAMIAAMITMPLATSALAIEYWDTEDPTGGETLQRPVRRGAERRSRPAPDVLRAPPGRPL